MIRWLRSIFTPEFREKIRIAHEQQGAREVFGTPDLVERFEQYRAEIRRKQEGKG